MLEEERNWTAFASNVGKSRILRREAVEIRLRWVGAVLLVLLISAAGFLTVRYYGLRAGWWTSLLPIDQVSAAFQTAWSWASDLASRILAKIQG